MTPATRNKVLVLHRWTGLTVGLVFVMLAVTAAILVFRPQAEPLVSPKLFARAECPKPAALDAVIASAVATHPAGKLDDIRLKPGGEPVQVRFLDRTTVHVDACDAHVLGESQKWSGLFGFPEMLHRFRFVEGETGPLLDGSITAVVLVLLIVGGVVVWWPATRMALRGAFKLRPHLKGIAFTLNLHNIVGIYTAVVLAIAAATAMPISFTAVRESLYSLTSSQRLVKPVAKAAPGAQPLPREVAWARARAEFPNLREAVLRIPRKADDAVEIFTIDADAPHANARSYFYVDPYTGATLQSLPYAQTPTGLRIYFWMVSLHTGAFGPLVQLLFLLGMLGVPVLAYTGFDSYLRRRFGTSRVLAPVKVRVAAIRDETPEIKAFRLEPAQGKRLPSFSPGAHISVQIRDGLMRQYSLCNGPDQADAYHIAVKREPESRGGSRALHERVVEGDVLDIAAPRNHFPLAKGARHHLLLAGGIGITPLLSMVRHLERSGASYSLKYFARSVQHAAFHADLSSPELSGKVDFHYALEPDSLRIYLHSLLRERPPGAHLYACGPRPFMNLVEEIALAGWPPESIHMEFFSADPAASAGERLPFEITLARRRATYAVPADRSILEVLAENGIAITSSCGQGVCGTCITGVLEGTPDHRDAFLSDRERKACDKIMPCVSRAKGPSLVLDL